MKTLIINLDNTPLRVVADTTKALQTIQAAHVKAGYSGILSLVSTADAAAMKLVSSIPNEKPVRPTWKVALVHGTSRIELVQAYANQGAARSAAEGIVQMLQVDKVELISGDMIVVLTKPVKATKQIDTAKGKRDWFALQEVKTK